MKQLNLISGIWKIKVIKEDKFFPLGANLWCFKVEDGKKDEVLVVDYNNRWALYTSNVADEMFEYTYSSPIWGRKRIQFIAMFNRKNASLIGFHEKICLVDFM